MRISVIDIGTNTILLLVVQAEGFRIGKVLHDAQVIARVGKGVDERRMINQETFQRASAFLSSYRKTSEDLGSERIVAVGTSALRDASNRKDFCGFIRRATGISIEILSGDEEAEWTYRGAIGEGEASTDSFTVLDIGGGSTEIISGTRAKIQRKASLNIGCVRIAERVLHTHPPTNEMLSDAQSLIQNSLRTIDVRGTGESRVIGVAGTVTTLAAMRLQLPLYDRARVEGYVLQRQAVKEEFERLNSMTIDELRAIPQISPGREDILLGGVLILREFMEFADLEEITVSDRGLRYGIAQREFRRLRVA
jgi:exopolyphosphatase/guanosine-5'-triphosphate,3'-diphosphate pyrophosphatase